MATDNIARGLAIQSQKEVEKLREEVEMSSPVMVPCDNADILKLFNKEDK